MNAPDCTRASDGPCMPACMARDRCLLAPPLTTCLTHLIRHPADEMCPTCGAYIAAGL